MKLGVTVLLSALTTAMAVPGPVSAASSTEREGTPTCTNVLFIGARGSGEPFVSNDLGMGKPVHYAYTEYKTALKARTVSAIGLNYPAAAVSVLVADKATKQKRFFEGIDKGVTTVVDTLTTYAAKCPTQRFVLAGYSQGAMVMHRAVWTLKDDGFDVGRIDGAVLIANGDRMPRKGILQYGSAENGKGISWVLPDLSGDTYMPRKGAPQALSNRLHSVCTDHDIVCDANAFHLLSWATILAGIKNHEKYAKGKPLAGKVSSAARAVAAQTNKTPLPVTPEPTNDWTVNRTSLLAEVNAARAQARWCGQVQWPAAPPLVRIVELDAAAQAYAERQSSEGFTGHYSPEGLGPVERAAAEGYSGGLGEALGNGQETARQIVSAWMSSPGHCRILMSAASVAGVGFADGTYGTSWGFLGDCTCGGPSSARTKGIR